VTDAVFIFADMVFYERVLQLEKFVSVFVSEAEVYSFTECVDTTPAKQG
jgi:hypothetical protein